MKHKRKKPDVRKGEIISAALRLAKKTHYKEVQRKQIADALGVTPPALTHHFGTMQQLQRAVMRAAVLNEDLLVIAQGIVANDEYTRTAPEALKRRAMELAFIEF